VLGWGEATFKKILCLLHYSILLFTLFIVRVSDGSGILLGPARSKGSKRYSEQRGPQGHAQKNPKNSAYTA